MRASVLARLAAAAVRRTPDGGVGPVAASAFQRGASGTHIGGAPMSGYAAGTCRKPPSPPKPSAAPPAPARVARDAGGEASPSGNGERRDGALDGRALSRAVMATRGLRELEALVAARCSHFNAINARTPEYGGRELAQAALSLAKLRLGGDITYAALAGAAGRLAGTGRLAPRDAASLAWAFARAGRADSALFGELEAAALQRGMAGYGAHDLSSLAWAYAVARRPSDRLFRAIAQRAEGELPKASAHVLSNLLWAFPHAGRAAPALFAAALPHAAARLGEFSAQELAMLLWAYAHAGHPAGALFDAAAAHVLASGMLARCSSQGLSMLGCAYAAARHPAPALLEALSCAAAARAPAMPTQDLVRLAWAAATVGSGGGGGGAAHAGLRGALEERVAAELPALGPSVLAGAAAALAKLPPPGGRGDSGGALLRRLQAAAARPATLARFAPHELATLAWAAAKAGQPEPAFFAAAAEHARRGLGDYEPRWLATLLWAYAKAGGGGGEGGGAALARAARPLALARAGAFSGQDLAMAGWAFARLGALDQALARQLARAARRRRRGLAELGPAGLPSLLWALASVRFRAPELWAAAAPAVAGLAGDMSPQGLAMAGWAYGAVRQPAPALFDALAAAAEPRLAGFSPQGLAMLLWAFARLGQPAPALFDAAYAHAVPRLGGFDTQSVVMLAWAFQAAAYPAPSLMDVVPAASRMYGGAPPGCWPDE
eukprot:jgi/Tetstr1/424336/TSEL_014902.t1